jgi:chromosome segregation ATPase
MVEDLNRRNLELTSSCERYRINCTTIEKQLGKYQEIEREVAGLKRDLKEKDEKIYEMQGKEKSYKHLEDCYTKVRKEKDDHFVKIQEKNKENKALNLQLEELRLRVVTLEEELQEQEEDTHRNKERGQKMDLLIKENNSLNGALQEKINEIEKLQIRINNLENKISDKNNDNLRMKAVIDEKEQEISEMHMEIKELRERYETETSQRMAEQDKALKCTQEIFSLKCTVSKLEGEKQQLEDEMDSMDAEHVLEAESFKANLGEMEEAKKQSEKLLLSYKGRLETLSSEMEECRR